MPNPGVCRLLPDPLEIFLNQMKLLWLDINCSYAHASLALPAIHAQSADCGSFADGCAVEWDLVSATNSSPVGTLVEQIVSREPDVIAATCWLFTHEYLLKIIARVKALCPGCIVILGGPEFLGDNETYLRSHSEIDCVFRGEGEIAFHHWLEIAPDRALWHTAEGICFVDDAGQYHDGGLVRVMDFAALNPPESSRFFNWDKPFVQIETTRGCFNSCAFCVSGAEKPVRETPVESVRRRIENIHAHGIREIRLLDRTFNGSSPRAMALLQLFAAVPDMRFHLEIHPALLTGELRGLLERLPAGLLHLEAGIQSLHEPVLKACRRAGEMSAALDGLRFLCGLENTATHADLIVGLPLYTLEQIYKDIHTLASYGAGEIQLELLKVLPGTAMRRDASAFGIVYAPSVPYEVLQTREMSVTEIQTARLLSRLLDMYYNARAWQKITTKLILEQPAFLPEFLAWLRRGEQLEQPLSVEKRGLLLFRFCREKYPGYITSLAEEWTVAGLSLRKVQEFL